MSNKRAHADHVEVEPSEDVDIVGKDGVTLARDADHDATANLVAETPKLGNDGKSIDRLARQGRVNVLIKGRVGSLKP